MSAKIMHFEIPMDDPERAIGFYEKALGWKVAKWDGPTEYWLVTAGPDNVPGINGALVRRGNFTTVTNTAGVTSLDDTVNAVVANGGSVAVPKMAIPGIGWLAYCVDTEGNIFGLMQADTAAA